MMEYPGGEAKDSLQGGTVNHALVEHRVLDISGARPRAVVIARKGAYISLSPSAAHLLRGVAMGLSFDEMANRCMRVSGITITALDVEASYRRVVERIEAIERNAGKPRGDFWFKVKLFPEPLVARISGVLRHAYHPLTVGVLLIAATAITVNLALSGIRVEPSSLWQAYALFLLTLIAHEFGHASACAHYGAKPSEIGFAIYLIYPAFYSNVSAAWTLRRWQRVVVDLGGVYFQLVMGIIYVLAYTCSGWEPALLATWMIVGSCVFSLSPILKFDGYWVVADALGIANLARQPARIVRHAFARMLGRRVQPLPWTTGTTAVLGVYTVATASFWIWFCAAVLPTLATIFVAAVTSLWRLILELLLARAWPEDRSLSDVATTIYVLLIPTTLIGRMVLFFLAQLRKRLNRYRP